MNPMHAFWILAAAGAVFAAGVKIGSAFRNRAAEMTTIAGPDMDMGTKG